MVVLARLAHSSIWGPIPDSRLSTTLHAHGLEECVSRVDEDNPV